MNRIKEILKEKESFERSKLDEQGNPFPMLKMKLLKVEKKLHNRR